MNLFKAIVTIGLVFSFFGNSNKITAQGMIIWLIVFLVDVWLL